MKKTTYILIGTLAVGAILSFLLPAIVFTAKKGETLTLARVGKMVDKSTTSFTAIVLGDNQYFGFTTEDPSDNLNVAIIESDEVSVPKISVDKSWDGNIDLRTEDNTLYVDVTMNALVDGSKAKGNTVNPRIVVQKNNLCVATITMPRGMLKSIEPHVMTAFLRDFRDADLRMAYAWNGFKAINCTFRTLDVEDN